MFSPAATMHETPTIPRPPTASAPRASDPDATPNDRTYATFEHLGPLIAHAVAPFVLPGIVTALVMWLIKRQLSPFLDDHGKESLNFQISLALYGLVSGVLFMCGIGVVLMVGVYALGIVGAILASIAANKGEYYRYPMCLRLIA